MGISGCIENDARFPSHFDCMNNGFYVQFARAKDVQLPVVSILTYLTLITPAERQCARLCNKIAIVTAYRCQP